MGSVSFLQLSGMLPAQAPAGSKEAVATLPARDAYIPPPPASAAIGAQAFVRAVQNQDFDNLGAPLLLPSAVLTGLEEAIPLVYSNGYDHRWSGMPQDPGKTCHIRARGIILVPKKSGQSANAVIDRIDRALSNPKNHPVLMVGVDQSIIVRRFSTTAPVLRRLYNLQASGTMQYLSEVAAIQVENGIVYTQRSLDAIDAFLPASAQKFPDKETGLMNRYNGQVQVLKIAGDRVVIVIEMDSNIARIHAPTCGIAADGKVGPITISRQPVRQRIEDRLVNTANVATDPEWARKHHIELAPSRLSSR